jgi:hypothetical protein
MRETERPETVYSILKQYMAMEHGNIGNQPLRRKYCCCVCNEMIWFRQKYSVAWVLYEKLMGP